LLYYSLKGYLECQKEKYYLFKIVLYLHEKIENGKGISKATKEENLKDLRARCR
jgi:hypothetical protein